MPLNLDDFRKASTATAFKDIECEELGGTVRLAKLRSREHIELVAKFAELIGKEGAKNDDLPTAVQVGFFIEVLALSVVDEHGNKVFAAADGREVLAGLSMATLLKIGNEAMGFLDFGKAATEDAKKNSKRSRNGSSRSGSR